MKASDINLESVLSFHPEVGKLLLNDARMLMFSQHSLATLQTTLVNHFGHEYTRAVFAQFGYTCGKNDYLNIAESQIWDSEIDKIASGPVMHMWEGIVHVETTKIEFNREQGKFHMLGIWNNSYEAENYLSSFGKSECPVCSSLTGYASGWATSFFGMDVLAVETSCIAMGHPTCSFDIRPLKEWGPEADLWKNALHATSSSVSQLLEEQVRERTSKLEITNRELELAKVKAEQANRIKGQFLANISHELRTPMNGVIGAAQLLLETNLDPKQRELLDLMIESGNRQVAIISDLLDFSKIESGKMTVETRNFSLLKLLRSLKDNFISQAKKKNIHLTVELDVSLPDRIASDSLKINQILFNLLSNAIKFTSEGGYVCVRSREKEGRIHIEVEDSGIGIHEAQLQNLFEPFIQADLSTTRKYGGTGLGLAICKDLLDLLGGTIAVNSVEGKGSSFQVSFPYMNPGNLHPLEERGALKKSNMIGSGDCLFPLSILVAEDNDTNAIVIKRMLEKFDCRPTIVGNGKDAIENLKENLYDLIFLDLHMPVMDGWDAIQAMRTFERNQNLPRCPIYALTADAYASTMEKCLLKGFDGFFTKPISMEQIKILINEVRNRIHIPNF